MIDGQGLAGAPNRNYFSLFGLEPAFALDLDALHVGYRRLQSRVHPDRYAHLSAIERRLAVQWSSMANDAYRTLRSPVERAGYLLRLNHVPADDSAREGLAAAFLLEQMEWREAIEEVRERRDGDALARIEETLRGQMEAVQQDLAVRLDQRKDYAGAREAVHKLQFLDKLVRAAAEDLP